MWTCQRTGACCRGVGSVTMTVQEQAAVMAVAPADVVARWEPHPTPGFVSLLAGPCPFLREADGQAVCLVHAARPYNCRKFGCFRVTREEPLGSLVTTVRGEMIPVRTLTDRAARRQFAQMVTKAERWGRSHGWQG